MTYAIICDANQGQEFGINKLALVDRTKNKRLWWTSDNSSIIMNFKKKELAEAVLKRLHHNNPQIVSFQIALNMINNQSEQLMAESSDDYELGWDAHKY